MLLTDFSQTVGRGEKFDWGWLMEIAAAVGSWLDRLEKDQDFRTTTEAIRPRWMLDTEPDPLRTAHQRYLDELDRFLCCPDTMRSILAEPVLKIWFFRTFGYRGDLRFHMEPSVLIRELPLLDIGRGARIGYGAVLRTGIVTPGTAAIRLAPIDIGELAEIGAHCLIDGGSEIGRDAVVEERVEIGTDCRLAEGARIGVSTRIGDFAIIGTESRIGARSVIGRGAVIDAGVTVEECGEVPDHHRLTAGGLFPMPHRRLAA